MRFPRRLAFLIIITSLLVPARIWAQDDEDDDDTSDTTVLQVAKPTKFYWGNSLDAAIFSVSTLSKPVKSDEVTPLRFTWFINFGFNFNYDINSHIGLFTGIGIKNIGFIEKYHSLDSTVKRRVYTLGVPLGIKVGNLGRRKFFFAGGGLDMPFNYREKGFIRRGNKDKYSEWFGDQTPRFMPYVFAGMSFNPGITLKLQYYPGNFLNTDYTVTPGAFSVKPFAGYEVHLIMLSLGFDIHYHKHAKEEDVTHMM